MTLENVAITSFWVDVDLRVDVAGELSGDDVDDVDDDEDSDDKKKAVSRKI